MLAHVPYMPSCTLCHGESEKGLCQRDRSMHRLTEEGNRRRDYSFFRRIIKAGTIYEAENMEKASAATLAFLSWKNVQLISFISAH